MNTFHKPSAQQARLDYRQAVAERAPNDMLPAIVPGIIPGDLDGLVHADMLDADLAVLVPDWRSIPTFGSDELTLFWAREGSNEKHTLNTAIVPLEAEFPYPITIPKDLFIEGRMLLSYEVTSSSGNEAVSLPTLITLDKTPPYGTDYPAMLDLATTVITDEWLGQNQDQVIVTMPEYPDKAPGDLAFFFWVKEVPEKPDDVDFVAGPIDVNQIMSFVLTRRVLEEVGDGECFGLYVIKDKAGNLSRLSWPAEAAVALGPLPDNLKAPVVPLALDGRIDRLDAFEGVVVEIPAFDGWKNGDTVHVKWGDTELHSYPVGPSPRFPLSVDVAWSALREEYDFGMGADQSVIVSYQVRRGGMLFPEQPLTTSISVNFEVVGPDNPNEPDPVNEELPEVTVRGESQLDNQLIESDHGKDATAYIPLYAGAKENDLIKLFWNNEPTTLEYYVKAGDIEGQVIPVDIPWSLIEKTGNYLSLPVFYRITDGAGLNYQQSKTTGVNIKIEAVEFPAPTFPDIYENDLGALFINCDSIKEVNGKYGLYVHAAPDGKYLKAGAEVTLYWNVMEWLPGGTQGPLVPGTELSLSITLDASHEVNGITWFIEPYATHIFPAFSSTSYKAGFSFARFETLVGDAMAPSKSAIEVIGLGLPGGSSCPIPTPAP